MGEFVFELNRGCPPEPNENVFWGVCKEYERVILQSLIMAFHLDFLVQDHHGGDVDTMHNVRQIDKDSDM